MSATSGGGGSVSEGSEAGGSSQSTMSVGDSPSTSFQANLTENVTKITLSEENSTGGFGPGMTSSKINLSMDERQQKDGIVNVAFDYEEDANRGNGDFKSINGSEKKDKVPEAVNLELVNMVPYSNGNGTSYGVPVNGIPTKKDSEQMDMSTPYDEYFVPVNEHKKYMRGEKLYVTKDKRRPTSWRRCLSWIVACTVISVVLILAILAGTGVILSQEPDLVKEASVGRNFGGSNSKQTVTNKSLTPTTEMYMYVPRSIESEFVIDNLDFDPAFKDVNSTAYKQFAASMEDQLKMLLFNKDSLEFGASDVGLRVVNVSNDPFKVNYRIGWNYKQGVNNPPEPIKMEDVKRRLVESLTRNQGYIDKYHIDREAIRVNRVINICQMENGGCSHICYYNYISQQFICTCPTHLVLDSSGKNCVAWTGSSEEDALPVPSQTAYPGMPYESTVNPVRGYETGAGYEHAGHGDQDHHGHKHIPEPTAEPSPGHDGSSAIYNEHGDHSSHDHFDHGSAPEPTAEPGAGNKYPHDYHDIYSEYESGERGVKPEPTAEENPFVKDHATFIHGTREHEPSDEPSSEPSAGQNSEGRGHDHDGHSVYGFKDHSGEPEPEPEPTAEPTSEGKDHDGHFGYGSTGDGREPNPEPAPEDSADKKHYVDGQGIQGFKTHEPSAEPTPEPSPEGDSAERHEHSVHSTYSSTDHQPTAQGDSESGHDHAGHSVHVSKHHGQSAEPTAKPRADGDSKSKGQGDSIYGSVDHEPSAEPTPEPTGDGDSDVKVHSQAGVFVSKDHEPSAEPTPEPTANGDSDRESSSHSIYGSKDHEPSAEPTPEPTADGYSNGKSQGHSIYGSVDREPSAEPTPEPTADGDSSKKSHGHSAYGNSDQEPSAEPTPEPTADGDSSEKSHEHFTHGNKDHEPSAEPTPEPTAEGDHADKSQGHMLYGSKDHEPSAEPTPEPTAEGDHADKSQGHILYGSKDHEPSAEPTPEPTAEGDHADKSQGHMLYGSKDHEPEPTPEPTAEGDHTDKNYDSSGHSLHGFNTQRPNSEGNSTKSVPGSKEHEPSAEPTPEPVAESDSETKDHGSVLDTSQAAKGHGLLTDQEPSRDSTERGQDQPGYSVYESKSGGSTVGGQDHPNHTNKVHEPSAEPTPEPTAEGDSTGKVHDQTGHSIYVSEIPSNRDSAVGGARDQGRHEPASGEEAEDSGIKSHQQPNHSVYESKTPSEEGPVIMAQDQMGQSASKDHDSSAEGTPESNADSKSKEPDFTMHTFHGSNAEGIPTGTSTPAQNSMVLGDQSTSSQTKPEVTEDSKLHSISGPDAGQNRDSSEPPRKSSGGDKSQLPETTINPLPAHGIVNSGQMSPSQEKTQMTESQTELTGGVSTGQNEPEKTHHVPYLEDILIRKPSPQSENTTGHSQNPLENVKLTQDGKPVIEEVVIDNSGRNSAPGLPSMIPSHFGNETNPDSRMISMTHHVTAGDSNQGSVIPRQAQETSVSTDHPELVKHSSGSSPSGEIKTHSQSIGKPTDRATAENKSVPTSILTESGNPTQENGPVTMHPESQFDPTIPVFVGSPESVEANTETRPTQIHATHAGQNSNRPSIMETDHMTIHPSTGGISNEGQTDRKIHETGTELPASATTVLTILTPEGVEKITGRLTKNMESKEPETANKTTNVSGNQQEGNETTKSPEEISNNIKDELSDNEEFNTLFEKDYKTTPTDGKEGITKYPNKSIKTEKKKIKDYPKGEKVTEITGRPAVTPEDFILQKHVNGNENHYDLDYSIQNEHTTKHLGEVTIADPHDGIPGVSFKPHGINNHDISILQTVAPDFRTETVFLTGDQELETLKPDSKTKFLEKEGESPKLDKDYPKFDKDYKYEKQKVSKKKDIKKKIGGKDGKNVELDDGRRYFSDLAREDLDVSQEDVETTMNPSFEKITVQPEIRTGSEVVHEYKVKNSDVTLPTGHSVEVRTDTSVGATELPGFKQTEGGSDQFRQTWTVVNEPVDHSGELNKETSTGTSVPSAGTVYDGQFSRISSGPRITIKNFTTPGTVFDGTSQFTTGTQTGQNTTFVYHTTGLVNSTTAHPTIIIHGQSGSLQDGHSVRFSNSTFLNPGNMTVVSVLNGTLPHSFSFTNYTFPNGSAVNPTIVIRGQSGTLQDGHQARFGNITFVTKNSNVYRIENETLPGTVFDGHFNPRNGHYHMYTNSSGTFVYTNASSQPAFVIKGESGDFGNSTAYFLANNTRTILPGGFVGPQSVIFRNSTVFAVGSDASGGAQEIALQPHELSSNETIRFTNQMSPSFISSGTAYKVNDYFGYTSKCAAGQFQCVNGTSRRGSACISLSSKCDSISDCSDGSDELGCIENGCPGNFQCADGTCLKRNLVCNGIVDCSDGSDEKNCEKWKCEFDEFQCPSGRCIPVVWQCDGKPDCDNHTDEYNCQTSCGNDEYLCPEGWCVPLTYKCNGVKECSNGEDEQLCDCSHEEFKCQTGGCVSMNQVCDGLDDCPDRSDEWNCVKLEPDSNLLKIRSASGDYEPVCADGWSSRFSDEVCASLGYFSSVPVENENSSSISTDSSFYVLKNDTTADFNKKIIVNLRKSQGNCSSGKLVEISCQEFSCGSRSMTDSSSVEARLVGGMSAASGQWPSVSLLYNTRNFHSCTANVLTPRWVLASYNCLKMGNKNLNEQDWKFFGGSTVFEAERENAETRKILRIIPHPQVKFNQFLFSNDMALVELDQSLQFTSNLGAVCLPEQEIQPRQICVTAGWGMNGPEGEHFLILAPNNTTVYRLQSLWSYKAIRQQLQYLPVPTMNLTECNSTEHYSGFITDDKICAGYNSAQKSLCYNEEGAPLICVNDRGEWELQGVLSYHSNCGRGSHPSIFSSITPVSDWIKKTIGNSFDRKPIPVTNR